jgi:hypothetical protein
MFRLCNAQFLVLTCVGLFFVRVLFCMWRRRLKWRFSYQIHEFMLNMIGESSLLVLMII